MASKARRFHPAGIFLIIIAALIVIVIAGFLWVQANPITVLRLSFTPTTSIEDETFAEAPDYSLPETWAAFPGQASTVSDLPEGIEAVDQIEGTDVFFIYPTTYLNRASWNAPLNDVDANRVMELTTLKNQASVYFSAGKTYIPRYRQATFGAFFDKTGQGEIAIERAKSDVYAAFDYYIKNLNNGRPFILAGHSQGALHALHLLKDRINDSDLRQRMIAAYIIGWPISIQEDLDTLGNLKGCQQPADTGCVISYQSFDANGDSEAFAKIYETSIGFSGNARKRTPMLCTNPLNWKAGGASDKSNNLGGVALARFEAPLGPITENLTGAKCDDLGRLLITEAPQGDWSEYVMAGGNYHVYDYNLFYMNLRANALTRAKAWLDQNS
ncbi:DUF3089 domain-containing protein [Kordiimonas sp. SCSIO 12610]|uniref:DUF3089 domain-containing protein n=1 Tax=Kordiimonas sp. SCSIO 12610 TaxID=2829597 RepID=UPI00210AFC9F|nr:DUF3089 domain-containing protein [Kordiimonas sp. SCSIO 12610]UTW54250.1 DUF3089 domain-containing protein [Kordiimonas sp. SCSIO 12610]